MICIKVYFENGYPPCDDEQIWAYEDRNVLNRNIENDIEDALLSYAEDYAYCHFGWDGDYTKDEFEEYLEDYCSYSWEEIALEDIDEDEMEDIVFM